MAYQGEDSKHCANIEAAQRAVAKATQAYRRGGSLDAVNKADRDLADANYRWYEWSGGNVPDDR
jgi:hypothetical protein